jgi:hypothetical protein
MVVQVVQTSGCPPIRRAWLTAIIEAAALLIHLGSGGVSGERRPRVGIVPFRDRLAGQPAPDRVWRGGFAILMWGWIVV